MLLYLAGYQLQGLAERYTVAVDPGAVSKALHTQINTQAGGKASVFNRAAQINDFKNITAEPVAPLNTIKLHAEKIDDAEFDRPLKFEWTAIHGPTGFGPAFLGHKKTGKVYMGRHNPQVCLRCMRAVTVYITGQQDPQIIGSYL